MESLRKWFYKPKKDDSSLLAQFFYADEGLNLVTAELDSFDGRKDPERCTTLVNHLRQCQDKVLNICNKIMNQLIRSERAPRDFRVKFPDDVMQENLAGQLWFGAECLAAGSSIMNRESESAAMRPLAKALTKSLEMVRNLLREQCLRTNANIHSNNHLFNDKLLEALKIFDRLFAEFELRYVSAMVPVKSPREYFLQQMVVVLFSETLMRALSLNLLAQEMVDDYDPALMFTIPRLAIVSGLLVFPEGPICLDKPPSDMSEMFRPFRILLLKIRKLLWTLSSKELLTLEKLLCSCEDPNIDFTESTSQEKCSGDGEESTPLADDGDMESMSSGEEQQQEQHQQEQQQQPCSDSIIIPEPQPTGYLIVNQVNLGNLATPNQGPVIVGHSLPDGDHDESLTLVTETLTSLLNANQAEPDDNNEHISDNECKCCPGNLVSPDSGLGTMSDTSPDDKTSPSTSKENGETDTKPELDEWRGLSEGKPWDSAQDTVSLDVPSRFVIVEGERDRENTYRIRTSTLSPLQDFEMERSSERQKSAMAASRRKRRRFHRSRSYAATSRDSIALHIPSHSKSRTGAGSFSSSCSSYITSDTCSLSSDTSSFNSEMQDDEEIALALQAAEAASWDETRSRFRSSEDLIHRLFVCIAGVADQLQTNFAGDLRNILKAVFAMNATQTDSDMEDGHSDSSQPTSGDSSRIENAVEAWETSETQQEHEERGGEEEEEQGMPHVEEVEQEERVKETENPPPWVPDTMAPQCMACEVAFTIVRRRHHCRNCGKVFCARCSSNSVPLPRYGHLKPVRVCNVCFLYRVTPFTMEEIARPT